MREHDGGVYVPGKVLHHPDLTKTQAILYGRILALSNQEGYCWASNKWLADDLQCTPRTTRRHLNVLEENKFLRREVERDEDTSEVVSRRLYPLFNAEHATKQRESGHAAGGAPDKTDGRPSDRTVRSRARHLTASYDREGDTPAREENNLPPVPEDIQQLAMQTYNHVPPVLAQWYGHYPPPWIKPAIRRTQDRSKTNPAYTRGILEKWRKQGGPDGGKQHHQNDGTPDMEAFKAMRHND